MTTVHADEIEQGQADPNEGVSNDTPSLSPEEMTHEQLLEAYKAATAKEAASSSEEDDGQNEDGGANSDEEEPSPFIVSEKSEEDLAYEKETYGEQLAEVFKATGLNAKAVGDHFQKTGEFPGEAYSALEGAGYSRPVVDAYLKGTTQTSDDVKDLADQQVKAIMNSVGGEAEYVKLTEWASKNLPEEKLNRFNTALDTGNSDLIQMAVDNLNAEYRKSEGHEPPLVGGSRKSAQQATFGSVMEMTKAVRDPRYGKDEAYTTKIRRMIHATDLVTSR